MSKTVLIVEKDLALMKAVREGLEGRGFAVTESTDGKGAPDLIRKQRPDLVVLAVDLDAGQNGYIVCKKLKSDAEVKGVPVVIIGDPKGFESHQKLKTRAEDYLGKPFEPAALVERVGAAIGFPPLPEMEFDASSIASEVAEEIVLDQALEEDLTPAPVEDFAVVDNVFGETGGRTEVPLGTLSDQFPLMDDDAGERTVVGLVPAHLTARASSLGYQSTPSSLIDPAEARELRSKVTELTGTLSDARTQNTELETRIRELETQLETKQTELETAKTTTSKGDSKEVFALKDAANKKDKEILRLKNELNAKEQEIVELRDKENSLEQAASESSGELAKKDAQIKTLQSRADQLTGERKRIDQQLLQAREEGRGASARLTTLQADYDAQQARLGEVEAQLEPMRQAQAEAERQRAAVEAELSEARGEIDALRSQLDERSREAEDLRAQHEQAQMDLDSTRNQLTSQATSFADEISGLRQRISDTEGETRKFEERANRHQSRVKAQQAQFERLRTALQSAMATLDEVPSEGEDLDIDELAEA